jgi:hypothetical protein
VTVTRIMMIIIVQGDSGRGLSLARECSILLVRRRVCQLLVTDSESDSGPGTWPTGPAPGCSSDSEARPAVEMLNLNPRLIRPAAIGGPAAAGPSSAQ